MKKFTINQNKYLDRDIKCYYNCEYIGYQKSGNPDFINHLKNMSKQHSELDLVKDFIDIYEKSIADIENIVKEEKIDMICVVPRSKAEKKYAESQLMFKKAISCVADNLEIENGTDVITRTKDTKTTHDWRLENNTGDMPYKGITAKTCEIDERLTKDKNILLVDDIYTEGVNVAEDCLQTLLDFGAKSVTLYVIARTRSN